MSRKTLRRIYASSPREVFFSGGEATLRGLEFFKLAQELGPKAQHHLQTNGLLINEEWADFLGRNRWIVGVSHDGPFSTRPQQEKAEDAILALATEEVEYTILCTVTKANVGYPEETLRALAKLGTFMQFIPAKARFVGDTKYTVTGEEFKAFLEVIAREVKPGGIEVSVRNFQEGASAWMGRPISCEQTERCGTYMLIHPDGDVATCDFFPDWRLGNIHDEGASLAKMFRSGRMEAFRSLKQTATPECSACPVYPSCRKGCPADRYLVGGTHSTLSPLCAAHTYVGKITKPR